MSVVIQNLTKVYGHQVAVDNVSFTIKEGEIVGFLGPNGAGKSTTMKIATTYLTATSGSVKVAGFDVSHQPQEVRRQIGYLPEHNPLYLDMFVREYLEFVARLYNPKGNVRNKVEEMIERCGLTREQNKKIENLSKGYRQRVGLAQALIHNPAVLILDEPTTGLDPNQILEIRKLIREVSEKKTVIFSTHIMQEVQALCDRVIVINSGKIVADDQLSSLMSRSGNDFIFIAEFDTEVPLTLFNELPGVLQTMELQPRKFKLVSSRDIRADIFRLAADKNLSMVGLRQEAGSLESIFQELTRS